MKAVLNRYFEIPARGSSITREARGALATFLTMAYILFVNPQVLAAAGVPQAPAVACTALAAGICCLFMGFYANFPMALASGMGLNAVVAYIIATRVGGWQTAMGLVVIEGVLILILVLIGFREAVLHAIPRDLRLATGGGIGLFLAFIGLQKAGLVVPHAETMLSFGSLRDATPAVAFCGVLLTAVLITRRVPGAIIAGIVLTTGIAFAWDYAWGGFGLIEQWPPRLDWPDLSIAFQADIVGALNLQFVPLLLSLIMVDFFDTLGTASAVAETGKMADRDGRIPGVRRVLIVDSVSASIGGLFGVSSVTSYVESAAGVAEGARTGLHSVIVGVLFLMAVFAAPFVGIVPAAATAPALILVGFLMLIQVAGIDFENLRSAIPAFLILLTIPMTFSISHGIGYGFISYVVISLLTGKGLRVHPLMYLTSAAFAAYFIWGQV